MMTDDFTRGSKSVVLRASEDLNPAPTRNIRPNSHLRPHLPRIFCPTHAHVTELAYPGGRRGISQDPACWSRCPGKPATGTHPTREYFTRAGDVPRAASRLIIGDRSSTAGSMRQAADHTLGRPAIDRSLSSSRNRPQRTDHSP